MIRPRHVSIPNLSFIQLHHTTLLCSHRVSHPIPSCFPTVLNIFISVDWTCLFVLEIFDLASTPWVNVSYVSYKFLFWRLFWEIQYRTQNHLYSQLCVCSVSSHNLNNHFLSYLSRACTPITCSIILLSTAFIPYTTKVIAKRRSLMWSIHSLYFVQESNKRNYFIDRHYYLFIPLIWVIFFLFPTSHGIDSRPLVRVIL